MTTKSFLLTALTLIGSAMLTAAAPTAGATVAAGQFMEHGKNYPLPHSLAYQTTLDGDEKIIVLLTGKAVSGRKLKEIQDAEKAGESASFDRPYLRLEYTKAGEFTYWSAGAGPVTFGPGRHSATGELKLEGNHAIGKATQPNESSAAFPYGFDVHFDTTLVPAGQSLPTAPDKKPGPAANVKPAVTGAFKGNGKEAKLNYVSAHWREPFDDKPSIVLVFTEKDHSKDKKPDFNAGFGKFGSALVISLHEDGNIFGCEVVHPAHKHQGFSSLGQVKTNDFQFVDGKVEGELTTDGSVEVFGDTWEAALKFVAPLGEIPAEFQPADTKKPAKIAAESSATVRPSDDEPISKPAANQLNVKDLAVTKDASDFEYKALVQHLSFKSKSGVKAVCAELAKGLKAQGWTSDGSDLITANSSILKRKRGEATLTIFVKPDPAGSEVKMMTEGLAWDEK